ncbi:S41 family peptidase [Pelistega sp. NLN82]|uniref:S41 family peptidase n=1 Tax=Pelistega ratti TaxID=2652177 RepID=A0A6L9Y837_9BURK|nr:S41 family peptidase [Pelistega ratti]NEN76027.1 S41 family peptidase [Pelistega ratti]
MKKRIFWLSIFFYCITTHTIWAKEEIDSTQVPQQVASTLNNQEDEPYTYEELRRFARAYALVKNQYVEPVSDQQLIDDAIEGMLRKLDPHSNYLNKEDMIDLQEETEGEFGGLGIEIGNEEGGYFKIISPIEDTPAAKAGILPGDLIVKVNGTSMKDKSLREMVKFLRGDPGTKITLTIRRKKENIDVNMIRELIKVKSVRSKMIGDIAYFRLTQFQLNTVDDLVKQIKAIKGTPRGIILDLRNNPGGLLNTSVGVVQVFSNPNKGVIVSTKARHQVVEEFSHYMPDNILQTDTYLKNLPAWLKSVPMVVLINVGSASASEIVAGALQDFKRATIMGNKSFGKGSVQVVMPIDNETGIKITTARYYTPNGRSIQAMGINPDIVVTDTEKGDLFSFPREVDLEDHLSNDTVAEEEQTVDNKSIKTEISDQLIEFGSDSDFQLQQAINHLKGKPVNSGGVPLKEKNQPNIREGQSTSQKGKDNTAYHTPIIPNLPMPLEAININSETIVPLSKQYPSEMNTPTLDKALDKVRVLEPK